MRERKVCFRPADNARVAQRGAMGGWDQMRARLVGDGDGKPMIVCFSTCLDSIRTLPAMQHDRARPEDMDSNLEDHAADEWLQNDLSTNALLLHGLEKPSGPGQNAPIGLGLDAIKVINDWDTDRHETRPLVLR
jgi:hypothetical protein